MMSKSVLRVLLTILMYSGVVVFLFPYFAGKVTEGILFIVIGASLAVVCGLLRCYLTEGDCNDPIGLPPSSINTSTPQRNASGPGKR